MKIVVSVDYQERLNKWFPSKSSMILVFLTLKKIFQFYDLDIENPLRRGTLAKIEPSL